MKGVLYIVSTPIGNLKDITIRAIEVLKSVDLIACEDTRVTLKLLNYYGISKPLVAVFKPKEEGRTRNLIKLLKEGKSIALVSDAGTPLLSDPGYTLVECALSEGIDVIPIPGASSILAALVASGIKPYPFSFWGFFPRGRECGEFLKRLKDREDTMIFFESPKRILSTLRVMRDIFGDRKVCVAREITKANEEFIRGSLDQVIGLIESRGELKGEVVIVVEGKKSIGDRVSREKGGWKKIVELLMKSGCSFKDMEPVVREVFGVGRKELYSYLLSLKGMEE
ncbi:MAG: 16S rRNA (cytidine(1402)-2'-O)-methyltransferase [Thermosulfidibacteraceae bacterium]|jgi:16S rRNA (cytidine1402-2'-O)-methyltransferase